MTSLRVAGEGDSLNIISIAIFVILHFNNIGNIPTVCIVIARLVRDTN